MQNNIEKNKRIAKNTLLLYIRMLFIMFVNLYTSRIVLNTLGVENYGIYNVVGGVVMMFSFFTTSLSTAISRFITYDLGKGDLKKLNNVFSTSVNVLLFISIIVIFLGEIIGLWFLNAKLNIPIDRLDAANWVFQFAIVTFIINLLCVPYTSTIIAHERMSVFAYISIVEVSLKFIVAYTLYISPFDKLKTYSILLSGVSCIILSIYAIYCNRKFQECQYRFIYDRKLLKKMTGFAGWNLMGSGAYLFNTQGVNIVTNLFFGVSVNAARGIATQVDGVIKQFVTSFTTAINPQITKSYAEGNKEYMFTLICRGSKYSYFLMLLFAVPFMFETERILSLWLGHVPEYTVTFLRLTMLGTLFDILGNSTANAAWATGDVKKYYLIVGGIGCLVFPVSYFAFLFGMPAYSSYVVFAIIYFLLIFAKLYIIKGLLGFPVFKFYKEVFHMIIPVTILSFVFSLLIFFLMQETISRFITIILLGGIMTLGSIYFVGMDYTEKEFINKKIKRLIRK